MSSIIKGLTAKEAMNPVSPTPKSARPDLLNRYKNKPEPKQPEPKQPETPEKKKEEQGLHLIAEANHNLIAKQKARFYLDRYVKEHTLVYQKLVDSIYKLAKETGVNPNDLRDAAPDIRHAKQELLKATQNLVELYDEALDLKMTEGQIYSTGGGAGQGYRWYKPQAAGLAEGNPVDAQQLDEKCWDTHKQVGMKSKGGKMVPNCVPKESVEEDELKELSKDTINDYISKLSAQVRGGREEPPKFNPLTKKTAAPSWKVAAGKVNPNSVMGRYAKVKAGDLQGVPEARFGGYYNPLDQERREQDSMDYERKKFKHDELSHELRNEPKNNYQVSIDGRAWKIFADKAHAEAVARKLRAKGKKAEVHLTGASPSVTENVNTLVNDAYKASFNAIQKVWTKIGKEPKNDQEFLDLAEQWGYVMFSKDASPVQAQEAAERLATALIPYWHDYHWKKKPMSEVTMTNENLRKWFKEKWVRFGPDGKIRGACARGDDSEGKPKCLPQSKAQSLGKKGRASAASRKRREDPNPERSGKAINVATKKKSNEDVAEEKLDEKKDACYSKVKSRYKVWPSAYASGALVKCRKVGASNWGNKSKAKESMEHTSEEKRKTDTDHVVNEYESRTGSASSNKNHANRKSHEDAKNKTDKAKSESSIIKGMVEAIKK